MEHLRTEFNKLSFKEMLTYALAILSMTAAIVCIFMALFIPPEGEIHASVLTYFGLTCGFVGTLLGISIHYSNELSKFKASIEKQISMIREQQAQSTSINEILKN